MWVQIVADARIFCGIWGISDTSIGTLQFELIDEIDLIAQPYVKGIQTLKMMAKHTIAHTNCKFTNGIHDGHVEMLFCCC